MIPELGQQSNPFSTGAGGSNFETRVQAAFVLLMLTGNSAPYFSDCRISKIKLQGRYDGYELDDFILFLENIRNGTPAKLLVQVKHEVSITANNQTFSEVIQSAWADFNNTNFDSTTDLIALMTGPLSATDIDHVRPILEWARFCVDSA